MCPTQDPKPELTEEAGQEALREHVKAKALTARGRHGPVMDFAALERLLADPECVRFPTTVRFDAEPLRPGEFAWPSPVDGNPKEGFTLFVHPMFKERLDLLPLICAYHVVAINYLDVATNVEAELYGATLLDLPVDEYYARLCALSDGLPEPAPNAPSV